MKKRGSITVLLSLTLMMVLSLEFTLLELIHLKSLKINIQSISQQSIENVFSEYNRPVWDEYGILMLDSNYGADAVEADVGNVESRMLGFINHDLCEDMPRNNFSVAQGISAQVEQNERITDQNGQAFIRQGAKAVKYDIGEDALNVLIEQAKTAAEEKEHVDVNQLLQDGENAIEQAKELQKEQKEVDDAAQKEQVENQVPADFENPITIIKEWKTKGILSLIVENPDALSSKAMSVDTAVSNRTLQKGNTINTSDITLPEKVLYYQYLHHHFSSYLQPSETEGMSYEMEYILCGKSSDRENLSHMAEKLLASREVENYTAILADTIKMQKALSMATKLAGFTENPLIIKAVQLGIVGAWALMESVLDIRLLLSGGKVALVKNTVQWTSDIYQLSAYFPVSVKAKECEGGISYQGYLTALLCLLQEKELGLRPLDLIEYFLNQQEDYVNVRMDQMICKATIACTYEANPLFLSMVTLSNQHINNYQFKKQVSMSY